ncbi:MAG: F0F1 ATP synthase subunit B [Patescibacteria group bacterium]
MDLITKLGIDWRLLTAQILNFTVLLVILNYFLYKPILKTLREREQKVKKSIEDSHKIEEELLKVAKEREEKLKTAKVEASHIIKESQTTGAEAREKIIQVAKAEAEQIIAKAALESNQAAAEIKNEVLAELVDIVISVTEKVLDQKITNEEDKKLISKSIKSIIKNK